MENVDEAWKRRHCMKGIGKNAKADFKSLKADACSRSFRQLLKNAEKKCFQKCIYFHKQQNAANGKNLNLNPPNIWCDHPLSSRQHQFF